MRRRKNNKFQKGAVGSGMIFVMLVIIIALGVYTIGGITPNNGRFNKQEVRALQPNDNSTQKTLQLKTFGYVTLAPSSATAGNLCNVGGINNDPTIIVGTSPSNGQTVSRTGQIKAWVDDEGAPYTAPNAQIDGTGRIISQGDIGAKADDNFLYSPALYIAPQTAESGGTAFLPKYIKGKYNNNPPYFNPSFTCSNGTQGPPIDPVPDPSKLTSGYCTAEFIWDVASLGLSPGTYSGQFVIHGGERDRGVVCINFTVQ